MATDLRNMMSDVIGETARRNDYEGNKGFVPQCKLDEIITEEVVMDVSPEINQPSNLVKVTAILLYITDSDARASLSGLYGSGLTDGHLPVVYDESAKQLASGEGKNRRVFNTSLEAFQCRRFVESQWHFHVPTLGDDKKEENGNLVLDARSILPILHCGDKRYSGAYGEVHQVKLHHGYLKITPAPENNPMLALKKLTILNAKIAFKQEEAALVRIKKLNHKHLVKLIDSFKRGREYFFLFPWAAGGDLHSLWKEYDIGQDPKQPTNRSPEMMSWLLVQLRGIVSAINAMHHLPDIAPDSHENGRHGDIRSQNILLFYNGSETTRPWNGSLCIADVGLARFHEKITDDRQDPTNTRGAFLEYAPPEIRPPRHGKKRPPRSRKYDIWSLGCLFHDLIAWVLFGVRGVDEFHDARRSDGSQSSQFYTWRMKHDTYKINPGVTQSISRIRKHKRCGKDTWLRELTNIVEKDLLQIDEGNRIDAKDLDMKLVGMLNKEGLDVDEGPSTLEAGLEDENSGERSDAVVGKSNSKADQRDKKKRDSQLSRFKWRRGK